MNNLALFARGAFSVSGVIASNILWTDNADGTATLTFDTDVATYAGVDYGLASEAYTASSFDYDGAGPDLKLDTSHTIEIPDPLYGDGEEDADTYYFRIFASISGGSGDYIDLEGTGEITQTVPPVSEPTYIAAEYNITQADPIVVTTSGVLAGDTLILIAMADNALGGSNLYPDHFTWPSGFVEAKAWNMDSPDGMICGVAVKKSAAGGETTLSIGDDIGLPKVAACFQFRGADPTDFAFATDVSTISGANASPWSKASGTCDPGVNDHTMVVSIMFSDVTGSGVGLDPVHTFATTTGTTGAWTTLEFNGNRCTAGIGYAVQTTPGAFVVTGTGTLAARDAGIVLVTIGLKGT